MNNFLYLLILVSLFSFSCSDQDVPSVTPEVLMENSFSITIDDKEESLSFSCPDSPDLYSMEFRQEENDLYFHSQGYLKLPLENNRVIKYLIIIYHEEDLRSMSGTELKEFVSNNMESVYFDIELADNETIYRNQFFGPAGFSNRTSVAENERFNLDLGEPVSFDCADDWDMVDMTISYSGIIKTEDAAQEIEITADFDLQLWGWR